MSANEEENKEQSKALKKNSDKNISMNQFIKIFSAFTFKEHDE